MTQTDQGFSIISGVFTPAEMCQVVHVLTNSDLDRTKAGARHLLSVPAVRQVALDPRMMQIARQFVGAGATPFRATLFDKSGHANWLVAWHQDRALPLRERIEEPEWGPWSTKGGVLYAHAPAWVLEQVVALRVSLDDSSTTNGPLRVLPNTHQRGVLSEQEIEQLARETLALECTTASGGVVAMRPLTLHASSKAVEDRPRRILHIEYASTTSLAPGIELAVAWQLQPAAAVRGWAAAAETQTSGQSFHADVGMLADLVGEVVSSVAGEAIIEWLFPGLSKPQPSPPEGEWNASLGSLAVFLAGVAALFCGISVFGVLRGVREPLLWLFLGGWVPVAMLSGVLATLRSKWRAAEARWQNGSLVITSDHCCWSSRGARLGCEAPPCRRDDS